MLTNLIHRLINHDKLEQAASTVYFLSELSMLWKLASGVQTLSTVIALFRSLTYKFKESAFQLWVAFFSSQEEMSNPELRFV